MNTDEHGFQYNDRYFKGEDGFYGVHFHDMYGCWLNAYKTDWKFAASLARINDFDGQCQDMLDEGLIEVKQGDKFE